MCRGDSLLLSSNQGGYWSSAAQIPAFDGYYYTNKNQMEYKHVRWMEEILHQLIGGLSHYS